MFQKNVLLAIPFSLLETCAQFPEFPMVALLNFTDLTPETISNHKKICSMNVEVHQKLPDL